MFVHQMRLLIIAAIAQFLVLAVQCEKTDGKRLSTVSELQAEYIVNEENLWQRIDRVLADSPNIDEKTVKETWIEALKMHRTVFFDDTFDTNSYWRSYLLYRIANFRDYLSNINDTLEENYRYLFDDSEQIKFNPTDVELWTRDTMFQRLKENTNGLFNLTVIQKDTVLQHIQSEAESCIRYVNYVISEAQLLREYYVNAGKALLRSYAMTQLAYMLMSLSQHQNLHGEANVERTFYLEQYAQFRSAVESMLAVASRDLWKCNPNPYLDSRTYYTSITNFMQGYIDNEINMNGEQNCDGTCSDYKSTKNHECQNGTLCAHTNFASTRCTGDMFNCNTIDSDGIACLVKDEWENRRYNYVTFRNGSMNGHNVLCFKAEQTQLSSQTERITNECNNCFCLCDEPGENSDRYFSLRDVTSDIGANKIVTGIALRKINRVIQFTISERELFAFGKVNDTLRRTQIWKNNSIEFLTNGKNGIDYFTLSREHRSINLDTIVLPLDKVVTGVRFQAHENRLYLEIRATDFDYDSGKLKNPEQSAWINNLSSENRQQINIDDPDSPTRTANIQERFDSNNKYIEFRPTDIKKDLAQLTVPYIESVALEASEPKPLSGVGLYYKGEHGFGGFIAVELVAHDTGII